MMPKAEATANKTVIEQVSLTIATFDCQNIFILQATGVFVTFGTFKSSLIFEGKEKYLLHLGRFWPYPQILG